MKTVLLNDKQRKKIVNLVKPQENDYYSYQNLNLLTAVYDEDTKIYLTLTYYLSSSIRRTDEHYDEYSYVLLTPMGNYFVGCKEKAGNCTGIISPIPILISNEKILEMIQYYKNSFSERFHMRKEAEKEMDLGGRGFTEWYLEKHYFSVNKHHRITPVFIVLLIVGMTIFLFCVNQEGFTGSRIKNPDFYMLDIERMNGTDLHTLDLQSDDVLQIQFETVKGSLYMEIHAPDGTTIYRGNGKETTDFTVNIHESGVYSVVVEARHAKGTIQVKCAEKQ